MEELRNQLLSLVEPVVERFGLDFIDLELKGSKNNRVVRVFVDTDGGVLLDTCVEVSRMLSDELDIADLISGRYRLEVSSPGIDRPLTTMRDFQRNLGREVKLHYANGDNIDELEGIIESVSDRELLLNCSQEMRTIPLAQIQFGKIKPKW